MSLNGREESAETSPGVRPRSWSCKGGCGGHPFKQASRRTFQGQNVRQPNESPAPLPCPAYHLAASPRPAGTATRTHHRLSERPPGPAVLTEALLNSPAAEATETSIRATDPRRSSIIIIIIVVCYFQLSLVCCPIRVPAFVKLRHECMSKDVYHLPLLPRVHESAQTSSTICLNPHAPCLKRHGAQWHLERRSTSETFCMHLDMFLQRRPCNTQAGAEGCSQVECLRRLP